MEHFKRMLNAFESDFKRSFENYKDKEPWEKRHNFESWKGFIYGYKIGSSLSDVEYKKIQDLLYKIFTIEKKKRLSKKNYIVIK